jgi:hypothetical protein
MAAASMIRRVDDAIRELAQILVSPDDGPFELRSSAVYENAELPGVCGLFGVGLAAENAMGRLHVRLLVDRSVTSDSGDLSDGRIALHLTTLGLYEQLLELNNILEVRVEVIDPPVPQFSPGDRIEAHLGVQLPGTLGCRVKYGPEDENQILGITTAGHVVCKVSYHSTTNAGPALRCDICSQAVRGTGCNSYSCPNHHKVCAAKVLETVVQPRQTADVVTFVSPMCQPASGSPMADIAISKEPAGSSVSQFAQINRASALDTVHTVLQGQVKGPTFATTALAALFPSNTYASWADVFLTAHGISAAGDSGAPVERGRGELVGHIIGGCMSNSYSIVQDAKYQLGAIGASFRQ